MVGGGLIWDWQGLSESRVESTSTSFMHSPSAWPQVFLRAGGYLSSGGQDTHRLVQLPSDADVALPKVETATSVLRVLGQALRPRKQRRQWRRLD